ncbi:MAG: tRNA (N6-isopentenyl adenosine(37)-C2)-methylthiotransferase MiaB [Armatimonadetes bacterium]|nr:tRNA (N6-isopentenyl adenosine(37)-C2)-methylthiotransferase MiaB [Armatimonadota bacterium]
MITEQPRTRKQASSQEQRGAYKIVTWGCQMNVEDTDQMALYLAELGLREAERLEDADVVLLNTCSVRRKPEDKAFSLLGELRKLKESRPETIIGVCGCMAQLRADEIRRRAPHVDFIVGTAQISQIPGLVRETRQRRRFQKRLELPPRKGATVTDLPSRFDLGARPDVNRQSQTVNRSSPVASRQSPKIKAFVSIQYGCDKFCAFCIVPTTRGRERSRPTLEILEEVRALADRGVKEVMLLGQTVNSYGKNLLEGKVPFARLLWKIAEIEGIERIRYISPYPRDYRDDLIAAHRDCPKIMPHVHLPLQSGNDTVLKEMRRVYTVESFKEIYWRLREIPGMAITTDIIVGFPGETEEQFQDTLSVVSDLRFDGAFMFAYSTRPGTPAGERDDQVPRDDKKRRLSELIALQNGITCEINESQVGRVFEVLVEGPSEKQPPSQYVRGRGEGERHTTTEQRKTLWKGLTRHGKTMHFPRSGGVSAKLAIGNRIEARAEEAHLWGFYGKH